MSALDLETPRTTARQSWWSGDGGIREVLRLSLPLVVSTMSWTIMNFIDRLFLFAHSKEAVAAALPASLMAFTLVCLPLGLASYANTFVSQYFGARRNSRIGLAVWQAVWIGASTVPLALLANPFAHLLFHGSGHPGLVARYEVEYFTAVNYGGGAMVIATALSSFFTGRGQTKTVMVVDSIGALLNCVLDYLWIFGVAGFPEWGVAGAAWATVVAVWFKVAIYFHLFLSPRNHEFEILRGCRFDFALMRRMVSYGLPSGLQYLFEAGAFTGLVLLIGKIGEVELAASSLALNVNHLAFMPAYGIGIATATLVGQRQGEYRPDLAERSTWSACVVGTAYMLLLSAIYLFLPDMLFVLHRGTVDDPAQFAAVRDLTVVLLRFVAAYCVFDGLNIIFCSAIKGAGDTRFVLVVTVVMSIVPFSVGWIGMRFFGGGLYWLWAVATLWISLLGVIYLARFLWGAWRTMRVIEPELD